MGSLQTEQLSPMAIGFSQAMHKFGPSATIVVAVCIPTTKSGNGINGDAGAIASVNDGRLSPVTEVNVVMAAEVLLSASSLCRRIALQAGVPFDEMRKRVQATAGRISEAVNDPAGGAKIVSRNAIIDWPEESTEGETGGRL